ncbi:histidine ammonia-lyase [Fictibacillus sp. Mic-4]|uniref:histidine ammonia-lyase n=1 Tax=Fictibacillus sp. Mic-4 TaxID=3132826 RepID=UPI003CFB4FDC
MNGEIPCHPKKIKEVILGDKFISINEFVAVARYGARVTFSQNYCNRVIQSRNLIEKFLTENRKIYGVTTGFGENVSKIISPEQSETLQRNIVRSHAVSVGEPLKKEVVRASQLMMLQSFGQGYSGVSLQILELIRGLLNHHVTPYVPGEGSVAYLAPEAHMALVLIGEGRAWHKNELLSGKEALERAGLHPITLGCKEGLSLLNGTSTVTAFSVLAVYDAMTSVKVADIAGAMSLEALKGTIKAFDPRIHKAKKHKEQAGTARNIVRILEESEIAEKHKDYRLQDAISLRALPQMHGAAKKAIKNALEDIVNEMQSCGDNPIVYPENGDGVALMTGNFDGTYVGIQADSMCIAITTLAKVSERRIDRLVNHHHSELPSFLVANPGLNNGYMIPQYTAAGLYGEMKTLSHPASIDNVPTCANQEDAVSFAYFAAKKAYLITKKLHYILAIELMCATQALDFLKPLHPGQATKAVYDLIRSKVPVVEEDRFFYPDIENIYSQVLHGEIIERVEEIIGELEI